MNKRPYVLFLGAVLLSVAAGWAGRHIPFSAQWDFFEALRTTASIVLAIMGAWVTILYPKALEQVIKDPACGTTEHRDRIHALLLPVRISTVVLVIVLALGPVSLLLKQSSWAIAHVSLFRGFSLGLLVMLTVSDMAAVILTIWPVEAAKNEIDVAHATRRKKASLLSIAHPRNTANGDK